MIIDWVCFGVFVCVGVFSFFRGLGLVCLVGVVGSWVRWRWLLGVVVGRCWCLCFRFWRWEVVEVEVGILSVLKFIFVKVIKCVSKGNVCVLDLWGDWCGVLVWVLF